MDIEDSGQLLEYLEVRQGVARGEVGSIQVLAGGVSNKTVLVRRKEGGDWVLKQALAKLRVEDDWYSDPLRIHREAEGMRVLKSIMPEGAVVGLVFEDKENHIIAMEAVEQPHVNWKMDLLDGRVDLSLVKQFGQYLAHIHGTFDREHYSKTGILWDRSFFESLRVEPYYLRAAEKAPETRGFIHDLVERTRKRSLTLVHGDYSPKNVLVHQGQLVLLDHEVIHIGDPAFDVGFSMTHLLSKANHRAHERDVFFDAAKLYWATYREGLQDVKWIDSLESMGVAHTLGCMLARIEGRSPLEYLAPDAKRRQKEWCMRTMSRVPATVDHLIESFKRYMNECL